MESPTPSTDDLLSQAQAAYQSAFDEYERLSWAGGADEASAQLREVAAGTYLSELEYVLREQKKRANKVEGKKPSARSRVVSAASTRIVLEVCEDRRGSRAKLGDGGVVENTLASGKVYAAPTDGRIKIIEAEINKVSQCDF
ncbi:hypothetical protein [Mariniluteicoccus endophyticus]